MLLKKAIIVGLILWAANSFPLIATGGPAQARIDPVMMHVGDVRTTTIYIDVGDVVDLYGVEARIAFDSAVVRPIAVRSALPLRLAWGNPTYNIMNDLVAIAIAGASAVTNPPTLFEVDFEAVALGVSSLDLPRVILNNYQVQDRVTGSATVVAAGIVATEASSWSAVKRLY
jgi:hypothetical protein